MSRLSKEFFKGCINITEKESQLNKYTYWAFSQGLNHYKLIHNGVLLNKGWNETILPPEIIRFINDNGLVLVIDNDCGLIMRSIRDKNFRVFDRPILYGVPRLSNNFKFGDWVILTEGALDADVASTFYQNSLAVLSAGLSQFQIKILETLTNRVILAYDMDDIGLRSRKTDKRKLEQLGFQVEFLNWSGYKDLGDLAEIKKQGNEWDFINNSNNINNQLRIIGAFS